MEDVLVRESNYHLGMSYVSVGNNVEAAIAFQKALKGEQKAFGFYDPRTLYTSFDLAKAYNKTDRVDEAIPLYQLAI